MDYKLGSLRVHPEIIYNLVPALGGSGGKGRSEIFAAGREIS